MASMLSVKWKPEQDFEGLFFLRVLGQVILINLCPEDNESLLSPHQPPETVDIILQ